MDTKTAQPEVLFQNGEKNYSKIKKQTEDKVVVWHWAKGSLANFEPYYYEEKKYPLPKKLKTAPKDKNYHTQYGVDRFGNIIVERDFNTSGFYESFYQIEDDKITSFRYSYHEEKEIINCRIYFFKEGKIDMIKASATYAINSTKYSYQNNLLTSKEEKHYDRETEKNSHKEVFYEYDDHNILNGIRSGTYYRYQRKIRMRFTKLKTEAEKRNIGLLKKHIKKYVPKEKIYTIYLAYDCQYYFPLTISFGTEAERKEWSTKEEAQDYIWNCAEYKYSYDDIEASKQDNLLFAQVNQEISMHGKEPLAIKSMQNIAFAIKESVPEFKLNITDDFVVVASDYEQTDLKKNFKKINPKKFNEFKKYLP